MQTLGFTLSFVRGQATASATPRAVPESSESAPSAEQFESVIGRAAARNTGPLTRSVPWRFALAAAETGRSKPAGPGSVSSAVLTRSGNVSSAGPSSAARPAEGVGDAAHHFGIDSNRRRETHRSAGRAVAITGADGGKHGGQVFPTTQGLGFMLPFVGGETPETGRPRAMPKFPESAGISANWWSTAGPIEVRVGQTADAPARSVKGGPGEVVEDVRLRTSGKAAPPPISSTATQKTSTSPEAAPKPGPEPTASGQSNSTGASAQSGDPAGTLGRDDAGRLTPSGLTRFVPTAAEIGVANSVAQGSASSAALSKSDEVSASASVLASSAVKETEVAEKGAQLTPTRDGTSDALQQMPMKRAARQNEFAGSAEQELPTKAVAPVANGPPARRRRAVEPALQGGFSGLIPASGAVGEASSLSAKAAPLVAADSSSHVSAPEAQLVEQAQRLMTAEAVQLRQSGVDSLRVVIRPDTSLQLTLHLHQRESGIEVQARLDHGDYGLLSRHWNFLQQQLDLRGIRLAPLLHSESFSGGGHQARHQLSQSDGQPAGEEDAWAGKMVASTPGSQPPGRVAVASVSATARRHWESWA